MVDTITAEVIRSKFEALLTEMRFVLIRSAYSTLMRESRDCSFGICSAKGEMPFEGAAGLHIYSRAAQRLLANYSPDQFRDGDIFIGNDPHQIGVNHSPDVLLIAPVLFEGTLVGFCGSIAHKFDFGGAVPGSAHSGATELFQEGLVLPIMKFYDRGKLVSQVEDVIRANVRNPDLVLGDLGAQTGATHLGVARVKGFAKRFGPEVMADAFEDTLAASEKRVKMHIARWPGKAAEAEAFLDPTPNHPHPVRIHLQVARNGGHLTFDFSKSDPQVRSPVNISIPAVLRLSCISLLGMTDPSIPENEGIARAVTLITKEGTVVSSTSPAPVGNTTVAMARIIDVALNALAGLKGEPTIAERGGYGSIALAWRGGLVSGRSYIQYEIQHSAGTGATAWCDGVSVVNPHSYIQVGSSIDKRSLPDTPVEVVEAQFPVLVKRFEVIPDSGGPGFFRGGVSRRRVYQAQAPAEANVRHAMGFTIPANGVAGGRGGRRGMIVVTPNASAPSEIEEWRFDLSPGDSVAYEGGGGGGFGDPLTRDPEKVLRDVREGLVSSEGASQDYGVVISVANGVMGVDKAGTEQLRASRGH